MIYLDNAATTRVLPEVAEAMVRASTEQFGNPSSLHEFGAAARRLVEESRATIARTLGVDTDEVLFTSGGTEANNLALRGLTRLRPGGHVLISAIEHPSVLSQGDWLRKQGLEVESLPVDRKGAVDLKVLATRLRADTRAVAVMAVNNETGVIQPIAGISALCRAQAPEAHVHCDIVQAYAKVPTPLRAWGVDSAAISAHKIHGPKGVGALYLRQGLDLHPRVSGGGQERGLRPGTENVPGIAGLAAATRLYRERAPELKAWLEPARRRFFAELSQALPDTGPLVDPDACAAHILAVRMVGCRSETLLHFLERAGLAVSSGSACHAGSKEPSHVLQALGYQRDPGSFRASVSLDTPPDALDRLLAALIEVTPQVRALSPSAGRPARSSGHGR